MLYRSNGSGEAGVEMVKGVEIILIGGNLSLHQTATVTATETATVTATATATATNTPPPN